MDKASAFPKFRSIVSLMALPVLMLLAWGCLATFSPSADLHIREVGSQGFTLEDSAQHLTLAEVAERSLDPHWRALGSPGSLTQRHQSALFLRVPYLPTEGEEEYLVLPNRAVVGLSVLMPGGEVLKGGLDREYGDQSRPFDTFYAFPIPEGIQPYDDIFIRFQGGQLTILNAFVVDHEGLLHFKRKHETRWIAVGAYLAIFVLSLFVALHFFRAAAGLMTLFVLLKLIAYMVTAFASGQYLSQDEIQLIYSVPAFLEMIASGVALLLFSEVFRKDLSEGEIRLAWGLGIVIPALMLPSLALPEGLALPLLAFLDILSIAVPVKLLWSHRHALSKVAPVFALGLLVPKSLHYVVWTAAFADAIPYTTALSVASAATLIGALYLHYAVTSWLIELIYNKSKTLKSQVATLRRQEAMRSAAFTRVSQVIQQPLGAIICHGEALLCGARERAGGDTLATIEIMMKEAKGILQLSSDLIHLETHGEEGLSFTAESIGIRQLFREIERINRPVILEKGLKLTIDLGPQEVIALGDPLRLSQVLRILVAEAISATEQGTIRLSAGVVAGTVRIRIQDAGLGMDAEALEALKSLFGAREPSSSVLDLPAHLVGLYVAAELIRIQGGTLGCSSTPGRGTTYSLQLKASTSAAFTSPSPLSPELRPLSGTMAGGGVREGRHRVLIVDDDEVGRQVMAQQLNIAGYDAVVAADGEAALTRVAEETPDLILLDIVLPGISGLDVCRRLRERYGPDDLPIIFMTGKEEGEDIVEGLQAGGNDYQIKPHGRLELMARIRTHIQLSKLTQAYSRFVPRQFLSLLHHESILDMKLGEQVQREMTIMFCDIRSFTTLSESMSPRENFNFLNSYLARVGPVIKRNGGFIDKYIGDGIMALFEESPQDAIRAAIDMRAAIREYNVHRSRCGYRGIEVGIGLHTGNLMLGTIGYEDRMESTVISDAVNLSSRLESLTKEYGVSLIVSEEMLDLTPKEQRPAHRYLGCVKVKGKQNSVSICEIIEGDTPEQVAMRVEHSTLFEQGVRAFEGGRYDEAAATFHKVLCFNPADVPSQIFLERCLQRGRGPKLGLSGEDYALELTAH